MWEHKRSEKGPLETDKASLSLTPSACQCVSNGKKINDTDKGGRQQ